MIVLLDKIYIDNYNISTGRFFKRRFYFEKKDYQCGYVGYYGIFLCGMC